MKNLQKLTNDVYNAAKEETVGYVGELLEGKVSYLQFVERLSNNPLNTSLAIALLANHTKILQAVLSCLAVKEVQRVDSEVSILGNEVPETT